MANFSLESKTARGRLEVRWKPYWLRLNAGLALGYRRTASGAGTWSVRLSDGKRGNTIKRIATADDIEPANGKAVMSFTQARDAALRLGRGEVEEPAQAAIVTLRDAIDAYRGDLAARGAGLDNVPRLLHNISPAMQKRPVALLDAAELRKWRDGLAKRLAPSGVNRLITILKAAMNLAASSDERLSAHAWRVGLAAIPEATVAHNVVLSDATIRRLVSAARDESAAFGLLVETLAITGARYSQLARCQVRDLVGDRLMIPSSAKGQKKRASRTPVPLPESFVAKLRVAAQGRAPGDALLVKASGAPWNRNNHTRFFQRTVIAIGEDPNAVSIYALRHSHITAQLLDGLPVQLVARLHDTSASQIERHYAATIASHTDELVRASLRDFSEPVPQSGNVQPIRSVGRQATSRG